MDVTRETSEDTPGHTSTPTSTSLTEAYDRLQAHPHIDGEGIELAMVFECLALENGANPDWDRKRLLSYESGRKGGLTTLARYGNAYFRALARARWGKTPKAALPTIRDAIRSVPRDTTRDHRPEETGKETTEERMAA